MTIEQVHHTTQVGAFREGDESMFRYLGLNPNNPADQAMVAVAAHYGLDPVLKHVVVIPKGGVYITRDGMLDLAHRSGQLDGIVVDQEPTLDQDRGEWVARVSVFRKDMAHPFTFPGRYPVKGGNRDYAAEMALKAAESHALRRAFRITGMPALDEQRPAEPRTTGLGAAQLSTTEPRREGTREDDRARGDVPVAPPLDVVDEPYTYAESEPLDVKSNLAKRLFASMAEAGIGKDTAHDFMSETLGRTVESSKELTVGEARRLLRHLPTQEA